MTPAQKEILDKAKERQAAENAPVGHLQGLADHFGQGISLGSIDEARAGFDRITGESGDYDSSMERQRRDRERYAAANPYKASIATALGAVAPVVMSYAGGVSGAPFTGGTSLAVPAATTARALPLVMDAFYGVGGAGKVAAANTLGRGVLEGAKAGVIPGAIEGYASANQNERSSGAATGAAWGVGLGGGIGGAGIMLPKAVNSIRKRLNAVNEYLAGPSNDPTSGSLNIGDGPSSKDPRSPSPPPPAPMTEAEAQIMNAMNEGKITPDMAIERIARARDLNVPLAPVDVSGQPVQRLARAVKTNTGPGSAMMEEALEKRAKGSADRVINAVERGIGAKSTDNPGKVSDDLLDLARKNSDPYYEQLPNLPPINTAAVRAQMETPVVRKIIESEEKAYRDIGMEVSPLYNDDGTLARSPTFEEVDTVKKIVGETVQANRTFGSRPTDPIPAQTRTQVNRAQRVVDNLLSGADASPGGRTYAKARKEFELPMQRKEAYEQGIEEFKTKSGGTTRDIETLRDIETTPDAILPENMRNLRRGRVDALRQRIQSPNDLTSNPNRVAQIAGNLNARMRLNAAVPNAKRRQRMEERLAMENQMSQTSNFVRGGSTTADKVAEGGPDIIGQVAEAAPGGARAATVAGATGMWNGIKGYFGKETRAEIAGLLTNMNASESIAFLNRINLLQKQGKVTSQAIKGIAAAVTNSMNE
jgi:hypothetical protein